MNAARRATLMGLVNRYGLEVGASNTTANEDVTAYFSGEKNVQRFCAVTASGEVVYLKAEFDTLAAAQKFAVSNCASLDYAEGPVCSVDLDTGTEYWPRWESLQWGSR